MRRLKHNGIEWLEFDLLAKTNHLKHATFLKHGGISVSPFDSLNTSFDVGDHPQCVSRNLELIQEIFQIGSSFPVKLMWAKQSHGKQTQQVDWTSNQETMDCDALMTNVKGLILLIKHADCQAAIFYDPKNQAIANAHAGWRGSVQNIYAQTIESMRNNFGTDPKDLLVCISPSLGPQDAEFIHYRKELPKKFWKFQIRPNYFDFWRISAFQLQEAGVLPEHIEISRISPYSSSSDYFSYRRQRITGRQATCILLLN